jgi:cellulose synthase/poly-beta-1,6-N-acetylglucosamine synthase-like glycosyltransferase
MTLVLLASAALVVYVYVGYPLCLWMLVRLRGPRRVRQAAITPPMSLVISAYNEAQVIARKLDNALALVYPAEALEIVVVSDASDDGTDEIVATYADRGVRCFRQPERGGKTRGLNAVLPHLRGDIVVFSDANAMYRSDALLALARNFADPEVGCATGEARYMTGDGAAADRGERVYWDYEIQIKRLETALGSMVGGDGAIYAIRRALWRPLPDNAINDFLNPLQIVAAGWRGVYEPEAVCYEETAGAVGSEFRRRVRIVSRSWRAVFQARQVLNPFRVGLFAWCVLSHKVLRWVSALPAVAAAGIGAVMAWPFAAREPFLVAAALLGAGGYLAGSRSGRRGSTMIGYFAAINAASIVGVAKGTVGSVSGVWTTPRQPGLAAGRARGWLVPVGPAFLLVMMAAASMGAIAIATRSTADSAALIFWTSAAVLAYVYAGYPALLLLWRAMASVPVVKGPARPSVCLFIAANNEETVIEGKIRNALALSYPADTLEIVVASDGSTDSTNGIVRRFAPRVRLIEMAPRRGKMAAIIQGMASVRADVVVFSDANTFLEPGAIAALVSNFADASVGAVSGDVALVGERAALGRSEDLYYRYERRIQRLESEIGSMIGADGALYAIRRELFDPPGADTILDDMAIPMAVVRQGYRVVFEPDARAREQGSESSREEFARKSRVIAGAVKFLSRADSFVPARNVQVIVSLASHKALRWLSPAFATCAFLSSIALADASRGYALAAAAQVTLLVLGIAGCLPALRRVAVVAVAHYFCLVQAAAVVGLLRGITGQESVLWRRFARVPRPERTVEVQQ